MQKVYVDMHNVGPCTDMPQKRSKTNLNRYISCEINLRGVIFIQFPDVNVLGANGAKTVGLFTWEICGCGDTCFFSFVAVFEPVGCLASPGLRRPRFIVISVA